MARNQVKQMAVEPAEDEIDVIVQMIALEDEGKEDEAFKLRKKVALPAFLGEYVKNYMGLDWIKNCGWNMSEIEAVYGKDYISGSSGLYPKTYTRLSSFF